MIEHCSLCKKEILTESNPYVCWNRPEGFRLYCVECYHKIEMEEIRKRAVKKILDNLNSGRVAIDLEEEGGEKDE